MNWDFLIPAILAAIPPTILAAAAMIQAMKTHSSVNSRMDEFKRLFEENFVQKGVAKAEEAQRTREATAALTAAAAIPVPALSVPVPVQVVNPPELPVPVKPARPARKRKR